MIQIVRLFTVQIFIKDSLCIVNVFVIAELEIYGLIALPKTQKVLLYFVFCTLSPQYTPPKLATAPGSGVSDLVTVTNDQPVSASAVIRCPVSAG